MTMENPDDHLEPDPGYQSPYHPVEIDSNQVETPPADAVEVEASPDQVNSSQLAYQRPLSTSGYISWLVVAALTLGICSLVATTQLMSEDQIGGDAGPMDLMPIQLQGKVIVGQQELVKSAPGAVAPALPDQLDTGCYEQRICYSILLNEVESPSDALDYLETLDAKVAEHELELTEDQTRMRKLVYELVTPRTESF